MVKRCTNPKQQSYRYYGGKGVTVCDRWLAGFENFLADMGERPDGMTLDRYPNASGNYEPGNCRWATPRMQQSNTSANVLLEFNGETKHISEWARSLGTHRETLVGRLRRGWSVERALTTPVKA